MTPTRRVWRGRSPLFSAFQIMPVLSAILARGSLVRGEAMKRTSTILLEVSERPGQKLYSFRETSMRTATQSGVYVRCGSRLGSRATQSQLPLFPQQQTLLSPAV